MDWDLDFTSMPWEKLPESCSPFDHFHPKLPFPSSQPQASWKPVLSAPSDIPPRVSQNSAKEPRTLEHAGCSFTSHDVPPLSTWPLGDPLPWNIEDVELLEGLKG